ncbi:GNAT family N-acetyltransferase [Solibacillus daqui]|uniref:GNAT family N-acetyltransferase n=1 Tax=Solibacillus daqui TaxID=2912187 RepID=UPI002365F451|nr:GNAT family N-acetyltransferase [Solibacillus daqui]
MLTMITFDETEKWNTIVEKFKDFDVYYLSTYLEAFKIHGDGEPILFYYEDENITAINVVMKRDIAADVRFHNKVNPHTFYDIATPYGYGGFLIEGTITEANLQKLNDEYNELCAKEGIVSEIVRFHPVLNNCEYVSSMYEISNLGKTITLTLASQEEIWNNLNTNKKRWIKKALKSGVQIYWGRSPELFTEFRSLYHQTMEKNNAKNYYNFNDDFFQSVLQDMPYNSLIFYAQFEKRTIAMVITTFGNGQIHHHLSASDINFQHLGPTNLLMYEIACWGNANGFKTFHLGGGVGSKADSLYEFKQGFNKNSDTIFSIGKKIFDVEKYNHLLRIRKKDENFDESEAFFPSYRI